MSNDYSREVLRRVVAQVCQIIGWQGINSTPLDILVHILEKYILTICTQTQRYAEQFNRTEANLHDLGLVFRDIHIPLHELREYVRCVPPVQCHLNVPEFPLPKESHLNFLKPGSQEVLTRQVHVHEHLPAMYPEKEKDDSPLIADTIEIVQNGIDHMTSDSLCKSPEISVTDDADKPKDVFKRPIDPVSLTPPAIKRHRLKLEEEDSRTREISSVMMTMSGFLSPAREGKLPEARTPVIIHDTHPEKPKSVPHQHHTTPPSHHVPLPHQKNEHSEKKSKKNRAPNGKIDKVKKKDKSHKNMVLGKQKNSENRINKLAMHLARSKVRPSGPVKYHPGEVPPLAQLPPPLDTNLKVPKQEPLEKPPVMPEPPPLCFNPLAALPTPPVRHRNPETTGEPPPLLSTSVPAPPVRIKEERIDGEKLTSQPDRSKLNIFKKISSKVKDHDFLHQERYNSNGNVAIKSEKTITHNSSLTVDEVSVNKQKTLRVKNAMELNINSAVDLSSKKSHVSNQVINVEEYSSSIKKQVKHQPVEELPRDLTKPKASLPPNVQPRPATKERKEKKHRERKPKPDKAMKDFAKMLKKQQQAQEQLKELEAQKKFAQNLPQFPFFGGLANRGFSGLMSGPSLIPGGPLFSHLNNNAVLGGMLPPDPTSLLPNPFSLTGSAPNPFALMPPGLGNNPLLPNLGHSFGKISQMPPHPTLSSFFRRPSLEVIPIEEDNQPHPKQTNKHQHFASPPPLTIKEKEKTEKPKISPNTMVFNNINTIRTSPVKQSPPKLNPLLKMPPVKPDVTIKLNPPEKQKPIEIPRAEQAPSELPPPVLPPKEKDKDKLERKKDKLHKKEKRDKEKEKEQKVKKKKDKKERLKIKIEKKRDKEIKQELKEKLKKERKEKRKEKEKNSAAAVAPVAPPEGLVPKLTLKLGPSSPMLPPSPDNPRKLNIKPVVRRDDPPPPPIEPPSLLCEERLSAERSQSPELARISALVTRPPKSKSSSKHSNPVVKSEPVQEPPRSHSPPPQQSSTSPNRKNRPPSTFSKYKRIYFKPIPKKSNLDESINDFDGEEPSSAKDVPLPDKVPNIPLGTPFYMDPQGNKIWICPACGRPDNGSPMIGCDGGCDGWYHWVCVGIRVAPDDTEDWYCVSCIAKRTAMASAMASTMAAGQTGKKRGRKPKAEKMRELH